MSAFLQQIANFFSGLYLPRVHANDVVEILILAALLYLFMEWVQRTRAYTLLKGFVIVIIFIAFAWLFQLATILWLVSRLASIALLSLIIIFQPELRKALESLGRRTFTSILPFDSSREVRSQDRRADRNRTKYISDGIYQYRYCNGFPGLFAAAREYI